MNKPPPRSKELKSTLSQLESAIRDWEGIIVETPTKDTASQELAQRTQGILKKLKQQLDELSE